MTRLYEWYSLPNQLDIKCPKCRHCASFEFVRVATINLKKDIEFFQHHHQFSYQRFQSSGGSYWHAALYYPNLSGVLTSDTALPEGYGPDSWCGWGYTVIDDGGVCYPDCGIRQRHVLNWPNDAYYMVKYKQHPLWAYH